MKLWTLSDADDRRFASAGRLGTWSTPDQPGACPSCTASRQRRIQPLQLEWEAGPGQIGDFTILGFGADVAITNRALDALQDAGVTGFEPGPVVVTVDPAARKSRRRDPSPDMEEPLYELWVTKQLHLDPDRSSVELERRCATCGKERWTLYGVERWDSHWDQALQQLVRVKLERLPESGVFVREQDLGGDGLFRVLEFPGAIFCTQDTVDVIVSAGLTNIAFLEIGDTIDD